jgi:phosphoadenosine phosphosulfate reductase
MPSQEISQHINQINKLFSDASPQELLVHLIKQYGNKLAFATSLGAEDQVLTYLLSEITKNINIFTLDTGRLFPETLDLIDKTNKRFDINIRVFFPDADKVENMVNKKGINLFYESIENRKECCHIRKILPMQRALKGAEIWISGLRAEQSVTRNDLQLAQWDDNFHLIKVSPLRSWTESQIWEFIHEHKIPYNPLHDEGYPSIGCLPCTRAVEPGEDIRAGRWWWEQPEMKECGLHENNNKS